MYSREVADGETGERETLSFGVSGKLWNGVLVFYDRETQSLWTQVEGRAIRGARSGIELAHVDSVFTTWEQWRTLHPDTLVMVKDVDANEREESLYADYLADPKRLFLPELAQGLGGIEPKDLVWGVSLGNQALAVEDTYIEEHGVVNSVLAGVPLAWIRDEATGGVRVVRRAAGPAVLVLGPLPGQDPGLAVQDVITRERVATEALPRLRVDRTYWYAWSRSHPGSAVLAR